MKKLTTVLIVLFSAVLSILGSDNLNADKAKTKVLYVGYNPDNPKPEKFGQLFGGDSARIDKDYQTRWPAFKSYLEEHFESVACIDARDYKENMSEAADVTIFDELSSPIKNEVLEYDDKGKLKRYETAEYLSFDYNHATIFIGKVGPGYGSSLGSKLDWHCFCLEGDAHNLNIAHPIFNMPKPVKPTMVLQTTPENFLKENPSLPKRMPMWRVQELNAKDSDYMLGMVSRGGGFTDSPDAEYICGAESKSIHSVAMGRHGNLFLWGFSGSPDVMTAEARDVFFNTIEYMKKYKGTGLLVRKMNDRIIIRDPYLDYKKKAINRAKFEDYKKNWLTYHERTFARADEIRKMESEGKELTKLQRAFLNKLPQTPTFEQWFKDNIGDDIYAEVGGNIEVYYEWIDANREFFHNVEIDFRNYLVIDKEVKELGVSNRRIEILEKCIVLLEDPEQSQLAYNLLNRYSTENFPTAIEWKQWFEKNRSKLFFTEAGGYKWMINTLN